jgi:hypothetical protein
MNTPKNSGLLENALISVPVAFRSKIVGSYLEVKHRYAKSVHDESWDTSGLSAGKYCESVLRFLQNELTGSYTPFNQHIANFADECRKLVTLPKNSGLESLRIIIPRALVFLYTLRGKRGIGHIGGDVEANEIDSVTVVRVCDWVFCELIRIYHGLSLEEAQGIVDSISIRNIPEVWEIAGKKRVLRDGLNYKQKTLLLVYSETEGGVLVEDLFSWCEHKHLPSYRRDVLMVLHKGRMVEYDKENDIVFLSPLGVQEVEDHILNNKKC